MAAKEALNGIRHQHGGPFGAIIVRKGRVIAKAHNTVLKFKDPTCHAEINAIRQAARKLKKYHLNDCSLYTTSEPCPMCFSAIHWAKIRSITYATRISDVKKLGFNELSVSTQHLKKWGKSPVKLIRSQNKACRDLLLAWKAHPAARTY